MNKAERKQTIGADNKNSFHYEVGKQLPQSEIRNTLDHQGFAIVRGIPVAGYDTDASRISASLEFISGLPILGTRLKQDRKGTQVWLVRNEGEKVESEAGRGQILHGGKGSKSSDELGFHNDAAPQWHGHDIQTVALLVFAQALEGGETTLVDARDVYEVLRGEDPTAASTLADSTFYFDRTSGYDEGQLPYSSGHIIEPDNQFRVRYSPRIRHGFEIAGRELLPDQEAAITAWDGVLS